MNAKGDKGSTPLHGAAFKGHKEIAELLFVNGANVNVRDKGSGRLVAHGRTPIDLAIIISKSSNNGWDLRAACKETADLLRKHGGKTGEKLKALGDMKHLLLTTIAAVVLV
ncbi:MAG: hypothetical protein GY922_07410, partial [Proteobacteria bacterium]|nr:hypothetical protein [Pseudomonadota bacterium]